MHSESRPVADSQREPRLQSIKYMTLYRKTVNGAPRVVRVVRTRDLLCIDVDPSRTHVEVRCRDTIVAVVVSLALALVAIVVGFFVYRRRNIRARAAAEMSHAMELAHADKRATEIDNPLNREDFRVEPTALQVGKCIGRGGGGMIYQGTLNNARVAIKEIIANIVDAADVAEFENEGRMVASFRHPNVLTGYGCELFLYFAFAFVCRCCLPLDTRLPPWLLSFPFFASGI